ncbi:MAG: DUF6291 domain-containing protein [Acutalibacteraceae bacterium]|nr:DUF6291 domain-containing protein [Acutalibacteraceae bacterium]
MIERNSFCFYRSFYDAVKALPKKYQAQAIDAVLAYGLDGTEPTDADGVIKAIFSLIRPQIDANNKRYTNGKKGAEHGKKGGRPREQEQAPKPQQKPKTDAISKVLDEIPDGKAREVVVRWLEYKRSIGNTYRSDQGVRAMIKQLSDLSGGNVEVAGAIVDQSIANNWKGLFELKKQKKDGNGFDFEAIARVSEDLAM